MPSQPRPTLLVETLCTLDALLGMIETFHVCAREGRQAEAGTALSTVLQVGPSLRPVLAGIIAAQRKAAQGHDLTERPDVRVLCSIGKAVKNPNASNDETHSATATPTDPAA